MSPNLSEKGVRLIVHTENHVNKLLLSVYGRFFQVGSVSS
jgi:hypothetical protein